MNKRVRKAALSILMAVMMVATTVVPSMAGLADAKEGDTFDGANHGNYVPPLGEYETSIEDNVIYVRRLKIKNYVNKDYKANAKFWEAGGYHINSHDKSTVGITFIDCDFMKNGTRIFTGCYNI